MLTAGDLYLLLRRVRARTRLVLRTAVAVLRPARLRPHDGSRGRAALSPNSSSPASNPVTRAADTPLASAVTGSPGPVVPMPRSCGTTGPAQMSANPADTSSRAIREGSVPQMDSFARDGVLAPADMGGRVTGVGCASTRPAAAQRRQRTDGDGCVAAASTPGERTVKHDEP
jgi:hypothetical protein